MRTMAATSEGTPTDLTAAGAGLVPVGGFGSTVLPLQTLPPHTCILEGSHLGTAELGLAA